MPRFLTVCLLAAGVGLGGCGGCNDNGNVGHLPDAPPMADAAADAMADAVSLVILNHGVPQVGVPVYFLNADSSVASAAVTDANGIATAVVTAGGSVTAIRPFTTQPAPAGKFVPDELRTFVGVKPGDHLVLSRAVLDTVTATFDAAAPTDGDFGTQYDVFTTCGNGGSIQPGQSGNGSASPDPGGPLQLDNCHGTADLAVLATQAPVTTVRAGVHSNALAAPKGLYHAAASLPPGDTPVPVNLRGDAYADPTPVTLTYTNTPDSQINVLHAPILPHGNLGPFSTTVNAGAASLLEPTVPATTAIVDSTLVLNNFHEIVDWGAFLTTYSIDMTGVLLREVTAGPDYDLATGRISWTEATDGAAPDLTIVGILVRRPDPLAKWHWEIAAPYAASGIVLPHLPTDAFNWMPNDTDEITLDAVKNVKVTGGYDAVREHILDIHDETGPTGYVIGDHGRAVTTVGPAL